MLGTILHSLDELGELLQWLCHDDSSINLLLLLLLLSLLLSLSLFCNSKLYFLVVSFTSRLIYCCAHTADTLKQCHLRVFSVIFTIDAKAMDNSTESLLLYAARNGDIETVKSLVSAQKDDSSSFNLNCTGMYGHISLLRQNVCVRLLGSFYFWFSLVVDFLNKYLAKQQYYFCACFNILSVPVTCYVCVLQENRKPIKAGEHCIWQHTSATPKW